MDEALLSISSAGHVQLVNMLTMRHMVYLNQIAYSFEPWHGISNNVVCATSKDSDQPAHTRSLIRAFANRLNIL